MQIFLVINIVYNAKMVFLIHQNVKRAKTLTSIYNIIPPIIIDNSLYLEQIAEHRVSFFVTIIFQLLKKQKNKSKVPFCSMFF